MLGHTVAHVTQNLTCQWSTWEGNLKAQDKISTTRVVPFSHVPVKPLGRVGSWGPEASSALHPSSDAPSPA